MTTQVSLKSLYRTTSPTLNSSVCGRTRRGFSELPNQPSLDTFATPPTALAELEGNSIDSR